MTTTKLDLHTKALAKLRLICKPLVKMFSIGIWTKIATVTQTVEYREDETREMFKFLGRP